MSDFLNPHVTRPAIRWTSGDPLPAVDQTGLAAPLLVDATTGALLVSGGGGGGGSTDMTTANAQLTAINANTDRLEGKADTGNGILTTTAADVATLKSEAIAIDNKLPSLSSGRIPVEANNAASQVYNYTATGAVAGNTVVIGPIDCMQFKDVSVQFVSVGAGCQFTFQVSNDGTTWLAAPIHSYAGASVNIFTGNINSAGIYSTNIGASRYFRIVVAIAQTSGTTNIVAYASQQATPKLYQSVIVTNIPSVSLSASSVQSNGFTGYLPYFSTASTNATLVKSGTIAVGGVSLTNTSASFKYVKFFNLGSPPTVGTSTPILNYGIPPVSTIDVSMGVAGTRMSAGLSLAITGGSAPLDATPVAAGDVLVNITFL